MDVRLPPPEWDSSTFSPQEGETVDAQAKSAVNVPYVIIMQQSKHRGTVL